MSTYIDGVTQIPKPIDEKLIKKQRELEQKQRALEKKVRRLKRLEAGTQSPETAKAYRKELREAQHELKVFVDEHNDVLRRDYSREKYYGESVDKTGGSGIIKPDKVILGHAATPKKYKSDAVIDHIDYNGKVNVRSFYADNSMKSKDIHTTNHGNPKNHNYGEHGEHVHEYEWNENGTLKNKTTRELTTEERKENGDIL